MSIKMLSRTKLEELLGVEVRIAMQGDSMYLDDDSVIMPKTKIELNVNEFSEESLATMIERVSDIQATHVGLFLITEYDDVVTVELGWHTVILSDIYKFTTLDKLGMDMMEVEMISGEPNLLIVVGSEVYKSMASEIQLISDGSYFNIFGNVGKVDDRLGNKYYFTRRVVW